MGQHLPGKDAASDGIATNTTVKHTSNNRADSFILPFSIEIPLNRK